MQNGPRPVFIEFVAKINVQKDNGIALILDKRYRLL
jgi:hypothetical protein